MEQAAIARPDVADLINAAIEALAKARFELPALSTLRRLGGSVQEKVHNEFYVYRRRELEIAVIFELVAGIRAGEIYVEGADSFGNYQAQLFESEDSSRAANPESDSSDFPETADALVADLQTKLSRASRALEQAVGRYECVKLDDHGQPIVHRPRARTVPPSVDDLATKLDQRLPERAILEALYNTNCWVGWTRHFGPPGSVATQIDDPTKRYVLTTFTYGCIADNYVALFSQFVVCGVHEAV